MRQIPFHRFSVLTAGLLVTHFCAASRLVAQDAQVTCAVCHEKQATELADSLHSRAGLKCQDCHGGAAEYAVEAAQVKTLAAPGSGAVFDHGESFLGKVPRAEVPARCGSCHADIEKMNPYGLPADQLARYSVSVHGKTLAKGDDRVAVCTDCHSTHLVLPATDNRSPTHPMRIPETCGRCHSDTQLMGDYNVSTKVVDEYRSSVHGHGLLENHDTGMPTCVTCHDNHGAVPPGFGSVDAVCGRCHVPADEHFLASPHASIATFPRCIGCHGGDHGHAIARITQTPEDMLKTLGALEGVDAMDTTTLSRQVHPQLTLMVDSCTRCHDEDDEEAGAPDSPISRSKQMWTMLAEGELKYLRTAAEVDRVGRGVLLVDDERLMLADARSDLIRLQALQHTLDPDKMNEVSGKLTQACTTILEALAEKEHGLRWRHLALIPMWGFIAVFVVVLYVKYKRLHAAWTGEH